MDVEVTSVYLDELDLPLPGLPARNPEALRRFQEAGHRPIALVGGAKLFGVEEYLTADRIDAAEALRLGIVNQVLEDDFDAAAVDYVRRFAEGPIVAQRYMKENLNRAIGGDLALCLDAEAAAMTRCRSTEDHKEAVAAFVDKRPPTFQGR